MSTELNAREIFLVQFVLSMQEKIMERLDKRRTYEAVDYIRERLGYFESRCCGLNTTQKGGLSSVEIAELYEVASSYFYIIQSEDSKDPNFPYYVAAVSQAREALGRLRDE